MSYDINQPPEYVKIKPFRFVRPYDFCHKTCAKGRWVGKNILLAMSDEFRAYSKEYYEQAILNGKMLINHKKVDLDYTIRDGDVFEHYVRRVEPPILDIPIPIVFEDDNFLVVDKPPSMIVHTGGGYHFNCVVALLFFEHNQHNLHVLHRLDRLTSGLLLFSKNKAIAQEFHEANGKNTIQKLYFARVHGDFPENITENARPQYCKSMKDAIFGACAPEDQKLMCAKECKTLFKKIWYDEKTDSSLIECSPVTGKTHQIRVHLSDLGYPIWNDIGYGGKFVGNKILQKHFQGLNDQVIKQNELYDEEKKKKIKLNNEEAVDVVQEIQKENQDILENCIAGKEEWDFHKHPLEICLHSYRYKFQNEVFESQKPYWYEK